MAPVKTINTICIIVGIILLAAALLIGGIVTTIITKPIKNLTAVINDISELNMCTTHEIPKSTDEIGKMGNAVLQMQQKLSNIVAELNDIAEILVSDSNSLYSISEKVNEASTDNSATNEELAASMEETSLSAEKVNESIKNMNHNAVTVADKIENGTILTSEVMDKTITIYEKTKSASKETIRVYDTIRTLRTYHSTKNKRSANDVAFTPYHLHCCFLFIGILQTAFIISIGYKTESTIFSYSKRFFAFLIFL